MWPRGEEVIVTYIVGLQHSGLQFSQTFSRSRDKAINVILLLPAQENQFILVYHSSKFAYYKLCRSENKAMSILQLT